MKANRARVRATAPTTTAPTFGIQTETRFILFAAASHRRISVWRARLHNFTRWTQAVHGRASWLR
jgi:hypothetical protein